MRRRWQGAGGGGVVPVDALLDAAEATVSLGARELCCRVGADAKGFARAAENLKRVGQLVLSSELLRQVMEAEGKAVLGASDSGDLKPGWQAEDCKAVTPGGEEVTRLYMGCDGFTAPTVTDAEKRARRKKVVAARRRRARDKPEAPPPRPLPPRRKGTDQRYKEFKLVQFHDESMGHRLVSVTKGDCGEAGRVMRRDARRIGFARARQRLGSIDGAPWILNQVVRMCVVLTALCLDFYHLADNVGKSRRTVFGDKDGAKEAGEHWSADVLHTARHEGYEPLWRKLVHWRAGLGEGPEPEPPAPRAAEAAGPAKADEKTAERVAEADRLLDYVATRKQLLNYDKFLANGWRISCSPTESECGAVPQRVVGPGKRWDRDNAEAMMAMEAMRQSNQWDLYWATCAANNN